MITEEHEYFLRFILLLLQGGTEVLRCIADKALQSKNLTLRQFLSTNQNELQTTKALSQKQKDVLFPASLNVATLEDLDITLLSYLITNFLKSSCGANEMNAVNKIRQMRNDYSAHAPAAKMTVQTYNKGWTKLIRVIITVSYGLPEEKQNKLNDLIDSIENKGLDIVMEEIKKFDRFNEFHQHIEERLKQIDTSVSEIRKDVSDIKLFLQTQSQFTTTVYTPRGKLQLSADDAATLTYGQILLLQSLKDSITNSPSDKHKQVKEKVDNFVEDIKKLDVTVENVSEGSIILEFKCLSLTAVVNVVEYFNSFDIQERLGEIAHAIEVEVGGKIEISGTLDIHSFQDMMKNTRQMEHEKTVQFDLACNCIGGLLRAFAIFDEGTASNSLIESSTIPSEYVGKPVALQTSIDIGQIQYAIASIKKFLDMHLAEDSKYVLGTLRKPLDEKDVTENNDVVEKFKTQNTMTSDMKTSKGNLSSLGETLEQGSVKRYEHSILAVSGKKGELSDTLTLSSDEVHEYQCSICKQDGRNIEAVKFCLECENLCPECLGQHNRFPPMRSHPVLDFMSSGTGKEKPNMPIQGCRDHVGKLINVYCSDHDFVGCATCIAVSHRSCQGKQYVRDIASGIQPSKEISEIESNVKGVLLRLNELKQQQQDSLKPLQVQKENILKDLGNLRRQINEKLDKMETTLKRDIDSKIHMKEQPVKERIDIIDKMKSSIENIPKTLLSASSISNAELFVQLNIGKSSIQEHKAKMEELFRTAEDARMLKLVPSKDIQRFLTSDDVAFGRISENVIPKSIKHIADFNFHLNSDLEPSLVHDACRNKSGYIILVDFNNKRIKKLDQSFSVTEHVDVPDNPGYLCEIDNNQLAVTLHHHMKVQFVFQQPLKLGGSFSTGATCRGIDCYNAHLYLCCGGYTKNNEGPAHIEVYTLNGNLLRTYYEGLTLPIYIKVSDVSFISEFGKRNIRMADMFDYTLSEMDISALDVPKGMCWIGDDQLCVAGYKSNNIVLISKDGKNEQQLLTEADGIVKPYAVCFDKERSHLIVLLGGPDVLKVFKVEI